MYIERIGAGPPIVLIHGWAMHGGVFEPLCNRLKDKFTIYLVDLPGHGYGTGNPAALELAENAHYLLDQLPTAAWAGWSLGGLVALEAACRRPERISRLIMLNTSPRFVRSEDWAAGVDFEVFRGFSAELRTDYAGTIDRFLALEAHGSDHMRAELRTLRRHVFDRGQPSANALEHGLQILARSDFRTSLQKLDIPALWIAGRRDRLVPWQAMQLAASSMSDGVFARIEGGGHAPFLSHADEVANRMTEFLSR